jgi:hypothetical protein
MKRRYNWLLCWRAENIGGWRGAKLQAARLVPEYVVGPRTFKIKVGNPYTIFGVPSRACMKMKETL